MSHPSARRQVVQTFALLCSLFVLAVQGQTAPPEQSNTDLEPNCSLELIKGDIPSLGPFSKPINRYPIVSLEVDGAGRVKKIHIVKGTGIAKVDRRLKRALTRWQYKPKSSCPIRETTAHVTIDF